MTTNFNLIPREIRQEIFTYLPPKQLVELSLVCKTWKSDFNINNFIQKQLLKTLGYDQAEVSSGKLVKRTFSLLEADTFSISSLPLGKKIKDLKKYSSPTCFYVKKNHIFVGAENGMLKIFNYCKRQRIYQNKISLQSNDHKIQIVYMKQEENKLYCISKYIFTLSLFCASLPEDLSQKTKTIPFTTIDFKISSTEHFFKIKDGKLYLYQDSGKEKKIVIRNVTNPTVMEEKSFTTPGTILMLAMKSSRVFILVKNENQISLETWNYSKPMEKLKTCALDTKKISSQSVNIGYQIKYGMVLHAYFIHPNLQAPATVDFFRVSNGTYIQEITTATGYIGSPPPFTFKNRKLFFYTNNQIDILAFAPVKEKQVDRKKWFHLGGNQK